MNFNRTVLRTMSSTGTSTIAISAAAFLAVLLLWQTPLHAASKSGEAGFKAHCAACHADGGNIIKADKTLSRKDRQKNGVKTANDIVKLMRHPGMGMSTFDKSMVSDKDAKAIAEYIIKTFK
ncbi:MAG: c-type cytochrome [Desulfuromonadaceae bacterium]|nr:c-type cytochrome [Desulfuromonadaceae bacterium]